jgi:hypothetical protein
MLKRVVFMIVAVALAASVSAQPAAKQAAKETKASSKNETAVKAAPVPEPLPVNVKIEISITDQTGGGQAAKKVVTMIARDRGNNSIRSGANVPVKSGGMVTYRNVTINVDASPQIVVKEPNKVMLVFGLEYLPKSAGGAEELEPGMSQLNERLNLVLESGKPMIVSQAADPTSDRKITVEVTATILK